MNYEHEFDADYYKTEAESQAEKMARPMREFVEGNTYKVDGRPGQFVRSYRDEEYSPNIYSTSAEPNECSIMTLFIS